MDDVSAPHRGIWRRNMAMFKRMCVVVWDFCRGRNRSAQLLAALLAFRVVLWVVGLHRRGELIALHPPVEWLVPALLVRWFVNAALLPSRRRSTGRGKLVRPFFVVLNTLATLVVVWTVLLVLRVHSPGAKRLVLALALWVVVSALRRLVGRKSTGLAKLVQSAGMVLAWSIALRDQSMEKLVSIFAAVVVSLLCLPDRLKLTPMVEMMREGSMGIVGDIVLHDPWIEIYAFAPVLWIALSSLYGRLGVLEWGGADPPSEEVVSSSLISALAEKDLRVFLSFNRGPDIPDGFIDLLMVHLRRSGFSVFGDGEKLPEGEVLIEVIKQSNISIPIISKGYASSQSCLVELGLMLACRREDGQMIIPVFYDVDPLDVRQVRGSFEISLKEHEMKGTYGRMIRAWGRALREAGGLERFYSADINSWSNFKLIKQLHLDVLQLFGRRDIEENLVGIQDRLQEVMTKLGVCYKDGQSVGLHGGDVRVVGIYGTGGVGKRTLAKIIYKDIASLFDGCSYLEDIQERFTQSEGLESLQNQLISDLLKRSCPMFTYKEGARIIRQRFRSMRVLIVLDDVNQHGQLEQFVGKLGWFGPRSRIIVITRDYGLIDVPEVAERYEVEPLKPDQALFLFQRHASHVLPLAEGYSSLFDEIVSVTGRIPLAIEVLAPLLCRTPTTLWQHTLKIMRKHVNPVKCVLMASFEFLNCETREILLDIACFFVGKDIANPFSMWCACGYDPLSGIKALLDMSLVQIGENNKLWMHHQLIDLCQQIVQNEDRERPERRSRLWNQEDAVSLLKEKKGTERVQALNLMFDNSRHDCFACEEFEFLPGLRFLKLGKARIIGECKNSLSNLRWLDWQGCPETFGACDLHLKELVVLDLSWSKVAHDWKGWSQIKMPHLKNLNLTGCTGLLMTPDLSGLVMLEILILEHCSRLVKIDASVAHLKSLVTLNLRFCSELSMLPEELNDMREMKELLIDGTSITEIPSSLANMKKLISLSASNCFSLRGLPQSIGQLEALSVLLLDSAGIVELPDSIGELVRLKQLSLRNCRCLGEIPDSIGNLGSTLIELDVSGTGISKLPRSIRNLRNLKVLKMDSCYIREFPREIGRLTNLEEIHALRCRSLGGDIPSDIGELKSLRMLVLGYTRISSLPSRIRSLCCLQTLDLVHCDMIEALPILPSSLTRLRMISRNMKAPPFIDNLSNLEELCVGDEVLEELELPSMQRVMNSILTRVVIRSFLWLERFPRLKVLEFSHSRITDLHLGDDCLPQLTKLVVSGTKLRSLQQLPSTLSFLSVRGCLSLKRLPTVQRLKSLTELRLSHSAVREVEGLGELGALEIIDISKCKIRNLDGLGRLTSLISLTLSDCDHLRRLPDISDLRMLKILEIRRCREIKNIQGLREIRSSLEKLHVDECKYEDSLEHVVLCQEPSPPQHRLFEPTVVLDSHCPGEAAAEPSHFLSPQRRSSGSASVPLSSAASTASALSAPPQAEEEQVGLAEDEERPKQEGREVEEEEEEEEEEEDEQKFARFEEDGIVEEGGAAAGEKGKGEASNVVEDEDVDARENDSIDLVPVQAVKLRLRRLFNRHFPGVVRVSSSEKVASSKAPPPYGKDGGGGGGADEFKPSSVCFQNFINESNEKQLGAKCGHNRCNCFNGNSSDSSNDELDIFDGFAESATKGSSGNALDALKGLILCTSALEGRLLADIEEIMKILKRDGNLRKIVVEFLTSLGYDSSICKSKWDRTASLPAGEYEYIDVIIGRKRLLIDIDFRSKFEIARPTGTYKTILQSLPYIFVGEAERLGHIVAIMSEAARQSLKKNGLHVPPWRKAEYMLAKWLSPYTRAASKADAGAGVPDPENTRGEKEKFELIFGVEESAPPEERSEASSGGGGAMGRVDAASGEGEERRDGRNKGGGHRTGFPSGRDTANELRRRDALVGSLR